MAQKATIEEGMSEVIKTIPRMPRHAAEEFETQRSAMEYAPPSVREDFEGAAAAAAAQLPAERARIIERGLTEYQQALADRDRLRREFTAQRVEIAELKAIITARDNEQHVIEDRVRACIADRDNAVASASELRGVLSSLASILIGYFKPENHQHAPPEQQEQEQDRPNE